MTHEKSRCKKNKYCAFTDVYEDAGAKQEKCVFCGRNAIFRKDSRGRIDNKRYLQLHVRDFCQPIGATYKVFEELYAKTGIQSQSELMKNKDLRVWANSPNRKKDQAGERLKEAHDYYRSLHRNSL